MKLRSVALRVIWLLMLSGVVHTQSTTQPPNPANPSKTGMSQDKSPSRLEYRYIQSARGVTKDGVEASFQTYDSSDGIRLSTRTEFFRSIAEMEAQFETKVKSFSEIIEGSQVNRVKGNVKVERVVGKYRDEEGTDIYAIIWNHDNRISYIESTSLDHILDFEKKFSTSKK